MDGFLITFFTISIFSFLVLIIKLIKDLGEKKNTNPWSFDELVEMTIIGINHINGSKSYNREVYKFTKLYNRDLHGVLAKVEDLRDYNQNMNFVFNEQFDKAFDIAIDKIKIH
jgi:hypothetical protein